MPSMGLELKRLTPWLGLLLIVLTLLADLLLVGGAIVGPVYVLALALGAMATVQGVTLGLAALSSLCLVIGSLFGQQALQPLELVSYAISLAAVWAVWFSTARAHIAVAPDSDDAGANIDGDAARHHNWLLKALASIGDGVIAADAKGRIEFINPEAQRLTGYSAKQALGKKLDKVLDFRREGSDEKLTTPFREVFDNERRAELPEPAVLLSRNGDRIPIDDSLTPIIDEDGQTAGAIAIFREVTDRRKAEQQMELRLSEARHRIRNVFANIRAILNLCERASDTPAELVQCVEMRIEGLVRSTERLMRSTAAGTSAREIILEELQPYLDEGESRLRLTGDNLMLGPSAAVSFAMIVHELANNASKYGALSNNKGRLEIRCVEHADSRIELDWRELGQPAEKPEEIGMGSRLISGLTKTQFGGELEQEFGPDGFHAHLMLFRPAERPQA